MYTQTLIQNGVTVTQITPLDTRIVRLKLSVLLPEYTVSITDEIISLYTQLALSGTHRKSKKAIEAYLRNHGLELTVSSANGFIHFVGTSRDTTLNKLVSLICEIIDMPAFTKEEFAHKRSLCIEGNREAHDDAKRIARINFNRLIYTKASLLYPHTLDEERKAFRALHYNDLITLTQIMKRGSWYLSVVGNADACAVCAPLVTLLTKTATVITQPTPSETHSKVLKHFAHIPGKTNIELRIGHRISISPSHPDYPALFFGIAVLGKVGGFAGRLMSNVREKEGLTYGIYASIAETHNAHKLHWNVFTFFTARDFERGVSATVREIRKIVTNGITEHELRTFKEILENQFILSLESNKRRLALYHDAQLMGYSEIELTAYRNALQQLTVRQVHSALKKYIHPKRLCVSGAGPVDPDGKGILG